MKLTMLHEDGMSDKENAYAYCENEMWSGWPCETEGCPHCGGPGAPDAPDLAAREGRHPPAKKRKDREIPAEMQDALDNLTSQQDAFTNAALTQQPGTKRTRDRRDVKHPKKLKYPKQHEM